MIRLGSDILFEERPDLLKGKRVGLLAHAASVGANGEHAIARILSLGGCSLGAVFGPEHGVLTSAEDMEPVANSFLPGSDIPAFSLYGSTRATLAPTAEMLSGIDLLVIDLQDIGSRYYTYIWTAWLCIESFAREGKPVIVCDRPNPIGGELVEGGGIEGGFESFVGLHSIPVRHGMTIGEILPMMNRRMRAGAEIAVIGMEGWRRGMAWPDAGIPWTNPSPNMRSYTAALLYPGMCLLEATNLSEGRGTDTPFEIVGAPFMDSRELMEAFEALCLPGVRAAPTSFIPTRQKWRSRPCQGVRWVVTDAASFRPYLTGLAFIWLVHRLYRDRGFAWRDAPYEFVADCPAIDLLTGSAQFREGIGSMSLDDLKAISETPRHLLDERKGYLLY